MVEWKVWILLGLGLCIAELVVFPAQFLLFALGVAALLAGVAGIFGLALPGQLLVFAASAAVLLPLFVFAWRRRMPVHVATPGEAGLAPQPADVVSVEPLAIRLKGDRFPAESLRGEAYQPGERVYVHGFRGITAQISRHP